MLVSTFFQYADTGEDSAGAEVIVNSADTLQVACIRCFARDE